MMYLMLSKPSQKQTDASENVTFPQLHLRAVINEIKSRSVDFGKTSCNLFRSAWRVVRLVVEDV